MVEITGRHYELAREACRNWARDGVLIWAAVAEACAKAAAEERNRCLGIGSRCLVGDEVIDWIESGRQVEE